MNNFNIAQCLYNDGSYSAERVQELLVEGEQDEAAVVRRMPDVAIDERPVRTAVLQAAGDKYDMQIDFYTDYMELFMDSMRDIMHTEAVVSKEPSQGEEDEPYYVVAQRISGDCSLVGGIVATEPVFIELAHRYSQEDFDAVDDMVVDSLEEFMNVLNGLYSVELANKKFETDLEMPRCAKNQPPQGSHQLRLKVYTPFGSMQVVMATDEII